MNNRRPEKVMYSTQCCHRKVPKVWILRCHSDDSVVKIIHLLSAWIHDLVTAAQGLENRCTKPGAVLHKDLQLF